MHPTGTGSFPYGSSFLILVDNLAFEKVVGIWGRDAGTFNWSFDPGHFEQSVPGNGEFWRVSTSRKIDQFVVGYDVTGVSLFDNNFGNNYVLDVAAAGLTDGVGTAVIGPDVLSEGGFIDGSSQLAVGVAVKNLAFTKQVAALNPCSSNDGITLFHDDPSAHKPCTKIIVGLPDVDFAV